jgi:hypothetical protein
MSATRSSLGTTAPSSTLISDRIARRIVRLDRAARSPWSSLTQSCQALSPRRDEIGRYQSVRVRSRIGTKRGRFACSTFERIESPGCPPKRSRRRATSATRSSSASARSTPRGIVSSQACSLDASHEKYWRSRQRRPGCKAAVESTSTGLTKSFCPFRLPSRGRQDRSTDAPILTRSRLRAESGAVLASTGADAEPCSVLDSPHLPAALGFFKLFARPFCPELGKRGYQYDLRRTLAKASS